MVEYKDVGLETRNGMGKTALQILDESHPRRVNYTQMKKLLTDPLLIGFEFSEAIPDMSSTMIVVAVLIATMAFQSAINPAGGVWNEDDAKSSRKAGEAVMASTHPNTYKSIMNANQIAFVFSIMAMFLFTIKKHQAVHPYFFIFMSFLTIGLALIAILITLSESIYGITPDEHVKFKRSNILRILIMVLVIAVVVPVCVVGVVSWYESWFNKKRRQLYRGAHAFLRRRTDPAAPAGA